MAKQKKKRNKKYSGVDAATPQKTVTKITAVNRSGLAQWFVDKKKLLRALGTATIIILFLIIVISGIVGLFN